VDDEVDVEIVVLWPAIGEDASAGGDIFIIHPDVGDEINGAVAELKFDGGKGGRISAIGAAINTDVLVNIGVGDLGEVFAGDAVEGGLKGGGAGGCRLWGGGRADWDGSGLF